MYFTTCNISATSLLGLLKPPVAISERLKLTYFQSPKQCALHDQYFPLSNKNTCVETLIDISLILMYNVKKKVS